MEEVTTKSKAEKIRDWAQFVILIFAGLWAAATFYYKEVFLPDHRPASLVVTGSLEEVGRKGKLALVRARVHVLNKEEAKICAPAFWFTVRGVQFQVRTTPYLANDPKLQNSDGSLVDTFSNYSDSKKEVIANWKPGYWENWYEKNSEETFEELFYVPHDKYQALELNVKHWIVKSIQDIDSVKWKLSEDGSFSPIIMMKMISTENGKQSAEVYDPKNLQHQKSLTGLGEASHISTLSFLPISAEAQKSVPAR
jgi:hypothetical protein